MPGAVVLDIEGTTSSLACFRDRLLPFALDRLAGWLAANEDTPHGAAVLAETRRIADRPHAGTAELVGILLGWASQDVKSPPLKEAQGRIWAQALADGELTAHFYPDVSPAIRRWHGQGLSVYVYSSGSALVQRAWFEHCPGGSLLPFLSGHFDTRNAGPKLEPRSYRTISAAAGLVPSEMLFLSDAPAELAAATTAGWRTVLVLRDGSRPGQGARRAISSFDELNPDGAAAARFR
jgi:enolase-phosphatase E1